MFLLDINNIKGDEYYIVSYQRLQIKFPIEKTNLCYCVFI